MKHVTTALLLAAAGAAHAQPVPCTSALECNGKCGAGDLAACVTLGSMFENGLGAPQDAAKARGLYRLACESGFAPGCLRLRVLGDAPLPAPAPPRPGVIPAAPAPQPPATFAPAEPAPSVAPQPPGVFVSPQAPPSFEDRRAAQAADAAAQRRAVEQAASEQLDALKARLCADTPFESPQQQGLPFEARGALAPPALCGLTGRPRWTVPFTLPAARTVTLEVSERCARGTCTLTGPGGERRLSDEELEALPLAAGDWRFTYAADRQVLGLSVRGRRYAPCTPGARGLVKVRAGEPVTFDDAEALCAFGAGASHFFELAAEDLDEHGVLELTVEGAGDDRVVLFTAAPPPRATPGLGVRLAVTGVSAGAAGRLSRLEGVRQERCGDGACVRTPPGALEGNTRLFVGLPASGGPTQRVRWKTQAQLHPAFNLQVAALVTTDGAFAAGGATVVVGGGAQVTNLLRVDGNVVAHVLANDVDGRGVDVNLVVAPLLPGLRVGKPRGSASAPLWARASLGPVLRTGTNSNYRSPSALGFAFRVDWKPFNDVPLLVGAEADLFALEPAALRFNLGVGL